MQPVQIPEGANHLKAVYWIDTPEAFAHALDLLEGSTRGAPVLLALDTEFERTKTYHPQGALMQISDGQQVFLVDLTQFLEVSQVPCGWLSLLSSPDCLKILHAGGEDLELIHHIWGVRVAPFFDTQWAADFVCHETQMGLAALVERVCQVELSKVHTRSNWLQRPLTQAQLAYAALDVAYLIQLYQNLEKKLKASALYEKLVQDFTWLYTDALADDPLTQCCWLPDTWRLSDCQRRRLLHALHWRQQFLVAVDIPKGWAISAQQLAGLCQNQIQTLDALTDWLKPLLGQHYRYMQGAPVEALFELLSAPAHGTPEVGSESIRPIAPLYFESKPLLECLKARAIQEAKRLGWSLSALSRKKWLVSWLRLFLDCQLNQAPLDRSQLPEVWRGWRGDCLHHEFLACMTASSVQLGRALDQLHDKKGSEVC